MAYPPPSWTPGPQPSRPHITPHITWYWMGGILAVVGTLIGLIAGVSIVLDFSDAPAQEDRFAAGESLTFTVTENETAEIGWELYVLSQPDVSLDGYVVEEQCAVASADGSVEPYFDTSSHWYVYDEANAEWELVALFTTSQPGQYTISCSGPQQATYGLLYDDPLGVAGRGVFALASIFVLPPLCIASGIIIIVVTRSRRRAKLRQMWGHTG